MVFSVLMWPAPLWQHCHTISFKATGRKSWKMGFAVLGSLIYRYRTPARRVSLFLSLTIWMLSWQRRLSCCREALSVTLGGIPVRRDSSPDWTVPSFCLLFFQSPGLRPSCTSPRWTWTELCISGNGFPTPVRKAFTTLVLTIGIGAKVEISSLSRFTSLPFAGTRDLHWHLLCPARSEFQSGSWIVWLAIAVPGFPGSSPFGSQECCCQ